ncbi:MAG TPA: hypothetical protein DCX14_04395 [Flavobacteriales bacterium]|nr:hypothetical protein [Flavobacteriales bacterium]
MKLQAVYSQIFLFLALMSSLRSVVHPFCCFKKGEYVLTNSFWLTAHEKRLNPIMDIAPIMHQWCITNIKIHEKVKRCKHFRTKTMW